MRRTALIGAALALVLVGCGADGGTRELVVHAAASLTDAFDELARAYEHAYPGTSVTLNLAGSQQLATQLVEGAPGDVFASADPSRMAQVADAGLIAGAPRALATNRLAIVVSAGNPTGVHGLADLGDADRTVVLADGSVPAGRYAREVLRAAGVEVEPDSLELDVRAVLGRVALGEADVGIVYESDVRAGGDEVEAVPIPEEHDVVARYPIAVLRDAAEPQAAEAFVAFAVGPRGRTIFEAHGFGAP